MAIERSHVLASSQQFATELRHIVTYDERLLLAAQILGLKTASPH